MVYVHGRFHVGIAAWSKWRLGWIGVDCRIDGDLSHTTQQLIVSVKFRERLHCLPLQKSGKSPKSWVSCLDRRLAFLPSNNPNDSQPPFWFGRVWDVCTVYLGRDMFNVQGRCTVDHECVAINRYKQTIFCKSVSLMILILSVRSLFFQPLQ